MLLILYAVLKIRYPKRATGTRERLDMTQLNALPTLAREEGVDE